MSTEFPASHLDLLQAPNTASLATVGKDGVPQVTALWYLLDDDGVIKISMSSARQKLKNLQARPFGTLFLIDPANPQRTLEVRGTFELQPDPDYVFIDRVVAHYGNPFDPRDIDQPGDTRWTAVLTPTRINAYG